MSNKGRFFVISAPSGTGKTTIVQRLLKEFPDLHRSISCTTRAKRPGEKNGQDYLFVDENSFREMVNCGDFFEWEEVHGALYGTPKGALLKAREGGGDTVLDIDTRGALNLKKSFPDSCLIFLLPPSLQVLEERLRSRQTEEAVSMKRRLENARREMGEKKNFNYVIINDDLNRAYEEVRDIILRKK